MLEGKQKVTDTLLQTHFFVLFALLYPLSCVLPQ